MFEADEESSPKSTPIARGLAPIAIGVFLGASGYLTMGRGLSSIVTVGDPLAADATFRTSGTTYVIILGVAVAIIAAGLLMALEEFWARMVIGFGAGLLVAGVWWSASQQIVLRPDGFSVRGALLVTGADYHFERGEEILLEVEPRPGSRHGDRHSVHLHRADGTEMELCHDTQFEPVWYFAAPHLIRTSRRGMLAP
ncbi:hypothetical protein LOC68_16665 [Blastopirellula sp. JC732]|uniref:Uncharacterized protein n=1 Tax=Blastopirellula sediminis TaxID=2894196 RepID=A0A9X1SHP6_9BACT|nr:hypothetical protein [Blastopirellula sediminis]MCC9606677.1 hypothetical protein [Blastopirellula sediminis]MCC9630026.1 hypothetical protein [Blastopirellula sediminis]